MQDYLISADYEKTLRVWDLVRPNCLQIMKFKEPEFPGKQSFASCFLDPMNGNKSAGLTTIYVYKRRNSDTVTYQCRAKTIRRINEKFGGLINEPAAKATLSQLDQCHTCVVFFSIF